MHPIKPSDWEFIATGHVVNEKLADASHDELETYYQVDHPKLTLADHVPASAVLPPGLERLRVITDWLRAVHTFAMKWFDDKWSTYPGYLPYRAIDWTLTVPATWSDEAKSIMRQAAYGAGMIDTRDSPFLQFRTEPESAAIAVMQEHGHSIRQGDTAMVIDAGGGTVDFSLHELSRKDGTLTMCEGIKCDAVLAGV